MENMKMAIIGSGMMGRAIITGIIQNQIFNPETIFVSDVDPEKTKALHEELGVSTAISNTECVEGADIVLIAVKPQFLQPVLDELHGKINSESLIISIVAGVPIQRFVDGLGNQKIVRVMPNTPAQILEGMSGWFTSAEVSSDQKRLVEKILSGLGLAIYFDKESDLDQVAAVSGSGPAYVFLFMEAMIDTAVHMGFPRKIAEKLVIQTVRGSADYFERRGVHPAVLRNEVTSPGGTTAEALYYMEKEGLRHAVSSGMWACLNRTIELRENLPRQKGPTV
ncbi:pyrroline-5-carboxylate reductase [Flexilinea flocculi]|jgi:pyrroline-5-carboxylate reductase|uniref:Pyrroline-5-carboxylate reductase n=1 Tax=Flexilinea flocculi TaxID=1678840 RepID=A0A0S7BWM9_9CHLR|nr:pyrroline-5-carboxylate reductase [Flexilinea flocculi]GAP41620.1 pyrroline-5-carboxylate reductase [Flexilinea flocculi]